MDHPVTNILKSTDNGLTIDWPYFDRSPDLYDFTGTPLARKHGGWDRSMPIFWFHHTLADVLNTIVDTGLRIERVVERPYFPGETPSELPDALSILARKPPVPAASTI